MSDLLRTEPLLELRDVRMYFHIGVIGARLMRALDGVTLTIHDGEIIGIAGESGCGKSTLARVISGLLHPSSGDVLFAGRSIRRLNRGDYRTFRKNVQMVFQDPDASLNPRRTIGETLMQPLDIHHIGTRRERRKRVGELLEQVNLVPTDYYQGKFPYELSGGAKQRVAIARALALRPRLIVADEPVASLDMSIRGAILTLLLQINKESGIAIVLISHNLHLLRAVTNSVAVMYLGRLAEIGPSANVFAAPAHPYSIALLSVTPSADPTAARLRTRPPLIGEPASAMNPPPGCSFHPRCPYAMDQCKIERPELEDISVNHRVACFEWKRIAKNRSRSDDARPVSRSVGQS